MPVAHYDENQLPSEYQNVVDYLRITKNLENGSWNDNALQTALCYKLLKNIDSLKRTDKTRRWLLCKEVPEDAWKNLEEMEELTSQHDDVHHPLVADKYSNTFLGLFGAAMVLYVGYENSLLNVSLIGAALTATATFLFVLGNKGSVHHAYKSTIRSIENTTGIKLS